MRLALSIVALSGAAACGPVTAGGKSSTGPSQGTSTSTTSASNRFPIVIHTANGKIILSAKPTAIISLSPTATEMLYAIGAGSQVKAVDGDSDYPPQAPRTKLSGLEPNVEAIVAYRPDLIVVAGDYGGLTARLRPFGIPVLSMPAANTLSDVYRQIAELGEATGHGPQSEALTKSMRVQIASILKSTPKPSAPITYYYELDPTYYSVTSTTFVGSLLAMLGMRSIADAAKGANSGYPQLSAEYILRADPEFIILADTICCRQSLRTVAARPGWSAIAAVKAGRVIGLNDDIASRWGPRVVVLLRQVAAALRRARLKTSSSP